MTHNLIPGEETPLEEDLEQAEKNTEHKQNIEPTPVNSTLVQPSTNQPHEPLNYCEANTSEKAHLLKPDIDDEYASLMKNETWFLTPLPPGRTDYAY